ncbi:helix-turn-helix domain-containing protein [Acidisoma cladoniae]|jgi:putative transcriptional regulator|uniref:helix-turn-helix domain-containing protein n=1 Tax=Acidisoma cladoniae TaxID=3040935 RepID=UPI00254F8FFC|nr:helix-turn-helix domain-containing protein [Acidisoma sp. PAMC 29798]
MTTKSPSRLQNEIMEMAHDQLRLGLMKEDTYRKITVRHIGSDVLPTDAPITGGDIRAIREKAQMSQGALARYLHMSTGYISKLERGETTATGPALILLNVIRRKGLEVLM